MPFRTSQAQSGVDGAVRHVLVCTQSFSAFQQCVCVVCADCYSWCRYQTSHLALWNNILRPSVLYPYCMASESRSRIEQQHYHMVSEHRVDLVQPCVVVMCQACAFPQ